MWSKKEFSSLTNTTPETLRYYEKIGLILPKRKENNYRVYGEEEYTKIKYIKVLQYANFSLEEIEELLQLSNKEFSEDCKNNTTKIFEQKVKYTHIY
ncbi:MerR family transcriptional regulator [Miniphocaeibacter massiliensis]|uniref:MerR family transcriptional regulator n=1 Tax=Miniphocaeibacter massiliensis TaxID=2041841 RepID=UPI000C0691F0|nr:MerR family transcriptional regulator [Miniphocaeibacter massiliensis]